MFLDNAIPVLPVGDIMFAFHESNLSGKVIVAILFLGSIYAWSIMVTKYINLKKAANESARFVSQFRKEPNPLMPFLKRSRFPESPLYKVYEQGCVALGGQLEAHHADPSRLFTGSTTRIGRGEMEALRKSNDRGVADQALELESGMGTLATAVSTSPFLGLLGTVWGVMNAFSGMAVTGSAQLSSVAPGIASALLTTVVALLVALPSAIGYNMLTSRIRYLTVQTDNFAQEFEGAVQREFLKE